MGKSAAGDKEAARLIWISKSFPSISQALSLDISEFTAEKAWKWASVAIAFDLGRRSEE
jgi:hypothetical protein